MQSEGLWPYLYSVVGRYANVSILDVDQLTNCTNCCPVCRCFRTWTSG